MAKTRALVARERLQDATGRARGGGRGRPLGLAQPACFATRRCSCELTTSLYAPPAAHSTTRPALTLSRLVPPPSPPRPHRSLLPASALLHPAPRLRALPSPCTSACTTRPPPRPPRLALAPLSAPARRRVAEPTRLPRPPPPPLVHAACSLPTASPSTLHPATRPSSTPPALSRRLRPPSPLEALGSPRLGPLVSASSS